MSQRTSKKYNNCQTMKNLFELVEHFSDLICTDSAKYCRTVSSSCNDENMSKYETSCFKGAKEYDNELRKKIEHDIEDLLGSTSEQALEVMHKLCNLVSASDYKVYFHESSDSTLLYNRVYFGKKRNRNSSPPSLFNIKSIDEYLDESKDHRSSDSRSEVDVLCYDSDPEEYCIDQMEPKINNNKHHFIEEFKDHNKPLQYLSDRHLDSFTLESTFSEDSSDWSIFNYSSNYESYDDTCIQVNL